MFFSHFLQKEKKEKKTSKVVQSIPVTTVESPLEGDMPKKKQVKVIIWKQTITIMMSLSALVG